MTKVGCDKYLHNFFFDFGISSEQKLHFLQLDSIKQWTKTALKGEQWFVWMAMIFSKEKDYGNSK